MTELEKDRSNRYHDIDFNKLVDELKESYESLCEMSKDRYISDQKISVKELIDPTINTLFALNCFLNRTEMDILALPFIVAAIGILHDSLSNYLDKSVKSLADNTRKIIDPAITTVNTSFLNPNDDVWTD
jgi:hypothetical protein